MNLDRHCSECNAPLAANSPQGQCVRCLLALGLPETKVDPIPPPTAHTDEQSGQRIGPYKLLEKLGEGGMGTVWMAEQSEPIRRTVALKIIKAGMDSRQILARFEAERQALALMDHPNIAKVLDAGTTGGPNPQPSSFSHQPPFGRPYFVMELVKGIPLTKFCDARQLPVPERLELFLCVCQAIQHAHQKGVIHRDIKPSNVLVALYDGKPVPKVIDFGVAKATGQRLTDKTLYTEFGSIIGTLEYMSPEQAEMNQLDIDTRSDIYSLGVLLYELLTGTTPLMRQAVQQGALDEVLRRIREEEPPQPSTRLSQSQEALATISAQRQLEPGQLRRLLRGDLDWVTMKALEKDRARRYETASALAADVECFLAHEAVEARPPSSFYRLGKVVRRNRLAFAAAGAVGLALVAGLVASVVMYKSQQKAAEEARAVSHFMVEVFQSPDPTRDGRTITVAEMLDRAVLKLDEGLHQQPEQRAVLQRTLAETYEALGLPHSAIPLLESVRAFYERTRGLKHPETLIAMNNLARYYYGAGRLEEALELSEQVLPDLRRVLGPEDPGTLWAIWTRAASYRAAGRLEEALNEGKELLTLQRKVVGPEHPDTLWAMDNLARSYRDAGRVEDALKLGEELLPLRRKVLGPEHPGTLWAMDNLAGSYHAAGRLEKALELWEELLTLRRKVLGPEHPDTLSAMWYLAWSYRDAGRREEALKLGEEVTPLRRKVLGPEHPDTLRAMHHLVISYRSTGRWKEAVKLGEEVLTLRAHVLGAEHPDTLRAMNNLAGSYHDAGRREQALKLREHVLTLQRKVLGPEHPDTLRAMSSLASSYGVAARFDDAVILRKELLALRRKVLGPEHPDTLWAMDGLADSYRAAGRKEESTKLMEEAVFIAIRSSNLPPSRVARLIAGLAEDLYRNAQYAESERWYREAVRRFGKGDSGSVNAASGLGKLLAEWAWVERTGATALPRALEAEELFREYLATRQQGANATHWRTAETKSRLAGALVAAAASNSAASHEWRQARLSEAEQLLQDALQQLPPSDSADAKYRRDAIVRMVRLYQVQGNATQAREWEEKLAAWAGPPE
jgi:eukaryotic-like serine/threonine-protein kinase